MKALTERIGKFDSKALAAAFHGATITPAQEPGILMETTWDQNGDIDRESFLAEIVDGKQTITRTLPARPPPSARRTRAPPSGERGPTL